MTQPTSVRAAREASCGPSAAIAPAAVRDIAAALNPIIADVLALYVKTKNFHWHLCGPHFRDYHLPLDEQADQLLAMVDPLAERVRKLGASTLRSVGHAARLQRIQDDESEALDACNMLEALLDDNSAVARSMRAAHGVCAVHGDIASASLLEMWIDEAERRVWFLGETMR